MQVGSGDSTLDVRGPAGTGFDTMEDELGTWSRNFWSSQSPMPPQLAFSNDEWLMLSAARGFLFHPKT